jgi:hypothetical protein
MVRPVDASDGRPRLMPTRVLARVATTGIYLVRGVRCEDSAGGAPARRPRWDLAPLGAPAGRARDQTGHRRPRHRGPEAERMPAGGRPSGEARARVRSAAFIAAGPHARDGDGQAQRE